MKTKMFGSLIVVLVFVSLVTACTSNTQVTPEIQDTLQPVAELVETIPPLATETLLPPATMSVENTPTITETAENIDSLEVSQTFAKELISKMTLEEKIGQMTQVEKFSISPDDVRQYGIGSVLSGGGGSPMNNTPENWLAMVNEFQAAALQTRLKIPMIYGVDAVHGHNNLRGAVIFPHNIGLGATRDADLVFRIGRATAEEVAATGIFWNFGPVVAVPQDIRWGRTYEGFGEQTALVSELAGAYIRGLQGAGLAASDTVLATAKHFVGDGGTAWGSATTNNYKIDQGVTNVDEATLRQIHLPPYQAAIAAGAQSIMVSFSSWGGTRMSAQHYLVTEVLKEELGFKGFVVSDWGSIDMVNRDYYQAVVASINAGVDMNMVPYNYKLFIDTLKSAVENGDVSLERIDDAVYRILTVKAELGLFEHPLVQNNHLDSIGSNAHRALAREAVAKSLVLLKNERQTLPISKDTSLILVGGQAAVDIGIQSGGWTIDWQGRPGPITDGTTIMMGIRKTVSSGSELLFDVNGVFENLKDEQGRQIKAPVGIAVVGEKPYAEGLGDSNNLALSVTDVGLINRMRDQVDKLVVIIISGRPMVVTAQLPIIDALVAAWLPGSEGRGVADVLFGDQPFQGKLPYSWPRSMSQLPFDFENLKNTGCDAPLFTFGYGLNTSQESDPNIILNCP
jgi:beta-glucosidase